MAPQLRSRDSAAPGTSPSSRVYHSAPPAQQARFPARRRLVKGYGRRQSARSLRQQTLTQIDYLVPTPPSVEWAGTDDDEHGRAGSGRPQKRRKTMGDTPESSSAAPPSSAFHTQTLTQMLSEKGEDEADDPLLVKDEEDDELGGRAVDLRMEIMSPVKKAKTKQNAEKALSDGAKSREVSVIPQTPAHKRIKAEIPSSEQSPFTPMLERYSPAPHRSPLKQKSTNTDAPPPEITAVTARKKTPRTLVIQDSYSPIAGSLVASASQVMEGHPSTYGTTAVQIEIPDSDDEFDVLHPSPQKTDETKSTASEGDAAGPGTPTPMPRREGASQEETKSVEVVTPLPLPQRAPLQELDPTQARHPTPAPLPSSEDLETDALSPSPRRTQHPAVQSSNPAVIEKETPPSSPQKSSPPFRALAARQTQARTQLETQGLESQRVPLEIINKLAPKTDRSDIIISIHPEHVERIVAGVKSHEFRDYRLPITVSRLWIYVTQPASELRYMATISEAKEPGQIDGSSGVGNANFNAGKGSKFAYELLQVYQLNNPVELAVMKENGWVRGPPQKYAYLPPAVVGELLANLRCALFAEPHDPQDSTDLQVNSGGADLSVSQEVEEQIRSDIARSTQHHSLPAGDGSLVIVPSSQDDEEDMVTPRAPKPFARPSLPARIDGASQAARSGAATGSGSGSGSPPAPLPVQETTAAVRPSQATTASQPSTPLTSPDKSVPRPMPCSSSVPEFIDDSPIRLALEAGGAGNDSWSATAAGSSGPPAGLTQLLLGSSQPGASGLGVQDSLVADVRAPPEFVWNSDEEEEDAD